MAGSGMKTISFEMMARAGASLRRPGLDRLRDRVSCAAFDVVMITAPDRLARNYVHQMLLTEELQREG